MDDMIDISEDKELEIIDESPIIKKKDKFMTIIIILLVILVLLTVLLYFLGYGMFKPFIKV